LSRKSKDSRSAVAGISTIYVHLVHRFKVSHSVQAVCWLFSSRIFPCW